MTAFDVEVVDPRTAWSMLEHEADAVLVDVRTRPEWSFVGTPDLTPLGKQVVLTEWRMFPTMAINTGFVDELLGQIGPPPGRILFLCRSGARSMEAAQRMAEALGAAGHGTRCVNVAEGFEGDLDRAGHRGHHNGWKAHGLAWRQS